MRHPFKRYCFALAEKLGKSLDEILALGSDEITEWMAYDMTTNDEWLEEHNKQMELAQQKRMSDEAKAQMFHAMLGGIRNGDNS